MKPTIFAIVTVLSLTGCTKNYPPATIANHTLGESRATFLELATPGMKKYLQDCAGYVKLFPDSKNPIEECNADSGNLTFGIDTYDGDNGHYIQHAEFKEGKLDSISVHFLNNDVLNTLKNTYGKPELLNSGLFWNAKTYGVVAEKADGWIVSFVNAETFNKDVNDIKTEHKKAASLN